MNRKLNKTNREVTLIILVSNNEVMISMNSEITKKTGRIRYSTGFGRFGIHVDLKNWVGVPEKEEKNKKQNRVTGTEQPGSPKEESTVS